MDYETNLTLDEILSTPNLCDILEDGIAQKIGQDCKRGVEIDEASREQWIERHDKALALAMQRSDEKSYPFEGASNIIYPLITTGANQFAARALPAIIPGANIVKCKINGDDSGVYEVMGIDPQTNQPQANMITPPGAKAGKAARVGEHMSYQLLEEMEEWEPDTDRLLHYLAIAGTAFRKLWYDNQKGRPRSRFIPATNLIVGMDAESLDSAGRVSERFHLHPHQVIEKVRRGEWFYDGDELENDLKSSSDMENDQAPLAFIEQYVRLDLDDDGYPEPYIVFFREDDGKVFQITPHFTEQDIEQNEYGEIAAIPCYPPYTQYDFLPNPENGLYGIGLGWLLGPLNEQINTTLNQINDAAHLQNTPMGFIASGLRVRGGDMRFKPGEFKQVDATGGNIRENLYQLQFPGPSPVLFSLLGMIIDSGNDIASVKDAMMGQTESNVQPMALQQLIEQGTVQFNSIFKRVHRSLRRELKMLFRLNALTLNQDQYYTFLDLEKQVQVDDYDMESVDVTPVTDPTMAARGQKAVQAQTLMQLMAQFGGLLNPQKVLMSVLEASGVEDPQEYLAQQQPPQPDFKEQAGLMRAETDRMRAEADSQAKQIESMKALVEMIEVKSRAVLNIAKAEEAEEGIQLEGYISQLNALAEQFNVGTQGMAGSAPVQANPQIPTQGQ
jgi:chaperonin GroES